ncbi:MAG: hypothetical protein LBK44_04600 [Spirochaetales bacterium]|nr:hypothetical protein [Spirochaetales bacterium]
MQILWAFRCNPLRPTGFSRLRCGSSKLGHEIASGNFMGNPARRRLRLRRVSLQDIEHFILGLPV